MKINGNILQMQNFKEEMTFAPIEFDKLEKDVTVNLQEYRGTYKTEIIT